MIGEAHLVRERNVVEDVGGLCHFIYWCKSKSTGARVGCAREPREESDDARTKLSAVSSTSGFRIGGPLSAPHERKGVPAASPNMVVVASTSQEISSRRTHRKT